MTPRIVSSTFKDGQFLVTVEGLETWEQAERVAAHLRVRLTEGLQEWTDAYVERLELIHGPKR